MRIFITGGTGLIGAAIIRNLVAHHHDVFALARKASSARKLQSLGATPISGDITQPETWTRQLSELAPELNGVIHAACDFSDAMPAIDQNLLDHLIPVLHRMPNPVKFIYTGGSWLFPACTADAPITETTAFDPLPEFRWMVPGIKRVLSDQGLHGMVIHPACVYATEPFGHTGLLAPLIETARSHNYVNAVNENAVCLPMVHADDLADLYRLALEKADRGACFNGVALNGISNRTTAELVAHYFGGVDCAIRPMSLPDAMQQLGGWARGLGRNQHLFNQRAVDELGWQPRHLDFKADIRHLAGALADA